MKMIKSKKGMMGGKNWANPTVLIGIVVALAVISKMVIALLPSVFTSLHDLENVSGFSFGTLFATGGVGDIIVSAAILVGILALVGFNIASKNKR